MFTKFFCGNHFIIYVSQFMSYILKLYSAICQLHINKSGRQVFKLKHKNNKKI